MPLRQAPKCRSSAVNTANGEEGRSARRIAACARTQIGRQRGIYDSQKVPALNLQTLCTRTLAMGIARVSTSGQVEGTSHMSPYIAGRLAASAKRRPCHYCMGGGSQVAQFGLGVASASASRRPLRWCSRLGSCSLAAVVCVTLLCACSRRLSITGRRPFLRPVSRHKLAIRC